EAALHTAGFDRSRPALIAWLGVVPYLTLNEIRTTLSFVATLAGGSAIVFDYGVPPSSLNLIGRMIYSKVAQRVASIGEPWKTYFLPEDLVTLLHELGFNTVRDFGPQELSAAYLKERSDGLKLGPSGRIVMAGV